MAYGRARSCIDGDHLVRWAGRVAVSPISISCISTTSKASTNPRWRYSAIGCHSSTDYETRHNDHTKTPTQR